MLDEVLVKRADENESLKKVQKISYHYTNSELGEIKKFDFDYEENDWNLYEICNIIYNDHCIIIKDNITSGAKFTFDSANKVKKASIVVDSVLEENSHFLDFQYENKGRSLTISDCEGSTTKYTFDSYHHTVSMTDSDGNTTFTEYEDIFYEDGEYVIEPNYDMNHKIISSSKALKNVINLVNNHSFELDSNPLYWSGSTHSIVQTSLYGEKAYV